MTSATRRGSISLRTEECVMRRPYLSLLLSTICLFFFVPVLQAQNSDPSNDTGIHPYGTYDGARENINLGTGNVFVSVPLLSLPGRNGHNYSVRLVSNSQTWTSNGQNFSIGMVLTRTGDVSFGPRGIVYPIPGVQCVTGYVLQDENFGIHSFGGAQSDCVVPPGYPNYGQRVPQYDILRGSDDRGEGIYADINACYLRWKNGDWMPMDPGRCPLLGLTGGGNYTPILTDSNGNQITSGATDGWTGNPQGGGGDLFPTGTDTDALGRSITYSNNTIQYKDSNGAQRTITLGVQALALSSCSLGTFQAGGTTHLITSAILPDGLTYIFHYDQCGGLDKIVYPSGGYTRYVLDHSNYTHKVQGQGTVNTSIEITAKYVCRAASVSPGATSTGETIGVAAGNTCPVAEDLTTYSPTSNSSVCHNSASSVVDPLGNKTVYQFTNNTDCTYTVVESSRQMYQGSSTLLRTIQTTYTGTSGIVYPKSITATLPSGLQSQVQYDYVTYDLVKEKREYAWGQGAPGALVRKTDYSNYCYDKKGSEIVYDGSGNQLAKNVYEFDNYTAGLSASGATQHTSPNPASPNRCNVTAIQRWRNTDGATLTTRMQYDDAGNVLSSTAPSNSPYDSLTRTTTYSYSDVWGNSTCAPTRGNAAAYATQVTDAAGLITKHSYNSCTGTVASTTDPNNQVTSSTYDLMDHLTQTTLPDTGQTSTCYSEVSGSACYSSSYPLKVVSTQKITSTVSKTSTALLDGLARVTQTQVSDPDCSTGVDKSDITYDSNERKSSVTNPYCTTSDATYGLTTSNYDALGRVTKVIPPDGTSSSNNGSTSYDNLPVVGAALYNCTIVTDQVGNQRRSCTDALGRLMEVDEPSAGIPGTPGTGSVTISGGERTTSYTYVCGPNGQTCTSTIPDVGTVSITVNGVIATTSYDPNSTSATIAAALTAAINSSGYPATASVNGSAISLTARTTGVATNYSLTTASATTDTQFFTAGSTSFPTTPSGATLTGGTDPQPGGTGTPSINTPLVTLYQYDVLNNLLRVDQKGTALSDSTKWRTRTFTYNSLSQQLTSVNPEIANPNTGQFCTVSYSYDNIGDLYQKTSPKPNQSSCTTTVTTTNLYEADNRLKQTSYNDSFTPTVQYAYDGSTLTGCTTAPPTLSDSYPKGRRTAMCDKSGATSWSHDTMGRIASEKRTIVGTSNVTKTTTYAPYNLDGSLATITYPGTGKVITYTYSAAGRATSGKDNGSGLNYAYGATYAPFGGLTALTMGSKPINVSNQYNIRLQPAVLSANTSSGTIMSLTYDFHVGIGDNGDVFQIRNDRGGNRTQNFAYDALNRIYQAYTTGPNWGEDFTIDPWGNLTNRSLHPGTTTSEPLNAPATNNNRLTGFGYDAPGNMTSNGSAGYTYDAENHLVYTSGYAYFYDGDGNRVKKCTSTAAFSCATSPTGTLYWRGAGGDPLVESNLAGTNQEEYIFFNGKRIARRDVSNSAVHYYFSDHLGTHSLITDAIGTMTPPQYEADFYPYGGEIPITSGDPNHFKFTGKERDSESGLDDFAARFDASSLGRFMSADPLLGNRADPQTLNRYAYARNSPTVLTDPSGLSPSYNELYPGLQHDGEWCQGVRAADDELDRTEMAWSSTMAVLFEVGSAAAQNQSVTAAYDPNKPLYTPHGVVYGNPRDPSNPGSALYDNPIVQHASDAAWMKTVNGTARGGLAEAGFMVDYRDGKISIANWRDSVNGDGKPNALTFPPDADAIAIMHVHGNGALATPSPGDRNPTTQIPDFVRSQRAVYVTMPHVSTQAPSLNDYVQIQ
jgi:RHS repeat-associated protein